MDSVTATASPSLALLKYWGKRSDGLPATPSIAVTLGGLETRTVVTAAGRDSVRINGDVEELGRFTSLFDSIRRASGKNIYFNVVSENNFPTAAGLASSSSGFAAVTAACLHLAGENPSEEEISRMALTGSVSASRAVFGGFVSLPAGSDRAHQLYGPDHWPELRILAAVVDEEKKGISSRKGMEISRESSPYYDAWLRSCGDLTERVIRGIETRDLEQVGEAALLSYNRMHAVMIAGNPPVRYWKPRSLVVQDICARLRGNGVGAWETMDAGPQVKIMCLGKDVLRIRKELEESIPDMMILESRPGPGVRIRHGQ